MRTKRTKLHGHNGKMKQWRRDGTGRPMHRSQSLPPVMVPTLSQPSFLAAPLVPRKVLP